MFSPRYSSISNSWSYSYWSSWSSLCTPLSPLYVLSTKLLILPGCSCLLGTDTPGLFLLLWSGLVWLVYLCTSFLSLSIPGGVSSSCSFYLYLYVIIHHFILQVTILHNLYHTYILFDWFISCSSSGSSPKHFIDCPSGSR